MKKILFTLFSILTSFAFFNLAYGATLTISPSSSSVAAGQTINVDIMLDTQGAAIDGVDLYYIHYNPAILEVQDSNNTTSGIQIGAGTLLPLTLTNSVNSSNGTIQLSQLTTGGTTYTGSGKLATITFKGLSNGTSAVTFDYTSGSTSDTNVAGGGQDKLSAVVNGSFTVSGSSTTAPPPTPTPTPQPTPQPTPLPTPTPQPQPTPTPPPSTSGTVVLTRNLYIGLSGSDVTQLQLFFVQNGYLTSDNTSGYFGVMTQAAVKKYQCDKGIVCSGSDATTGYGVVGNMTRATLAGGAVTPQPTPSPTPTGGTINLTRTIYIGFKGDDVITLQNFLIQLSYLASGNNTGYFGVLTRAAVRKYQCDKGIVCSGDENSTGYGLVGRLTRAKLGGQ